MSPLTPYQESALFLAKADPAHPLGVHQVCLARASLDLDRLGASIRSVAARHPVMRSVLEWEGGERPRFVLVAPEALSVEVRRAPRTDEEGLARILRAERARGLDLVSPPALHVMDVPAGDGSGFLVLTFHLALLDRAGARRLWGAILDGYARGDAHPAGGVVHTGGMTASPAHRAVRDATGTHWSRHLGGLDLPTPVPYGSEGRSPAPVHADESAVRPLDPELLARVDRWASGVGCEPARVYEAAWSVLLRRCTGRKEVAFGTSSRLAYDPPAGSSESVLPLAVGRDRDADSFTALCRALEEQTRRRTGLGEVASSTVQRAIGLSPATRLFLTAVALEEGSWVGGAPETEPAGPVSGVVRERSWTDVPVRLVVASTPGAEGLRLEHDSRWLEAGAAETLLAHYETLLGELLAAPGAEAIRRPYLPEDQRASLAGLRRGPGAGTAPTPSFLETLAERCAERPDAPALSWDGGTLTFGALDRASGALAHRLRDLGVGRDTRVALVAERAPETLVALLAVLRAGGAYVPLDPEYPEERRAYMLEDAGADLVLTPPGAEPGLAGPGRAFPIPPLDALLGEEDGSFADGIPSPEDLAYVIYTSGSTGRPKGVAMGHGALSNLVRWQLGASEAAEGDRTLQFASLSFDVSFQEIFATWCSGGTLVLLDEAVRRDPVALLGLLERERVARLFLPFVALQQIAAAAAHRKAVPHALREVMVAGEQLRITPEIRAFFRSTGASLENQYGPAETHVVTAHPLDDDPDGWPVLPPIGRPLPGTEVLLLDPWGGAVPPGVPGEIHIGGVALARGYLDRPDLTDERFVPHPDGNGGRVYRTGDLGHRDPDGTIRFVGRVDDQIKIRGVRVEPGEVEDALEGHPGVRSAAVAPRLDAGGSRTLVACFVPAGEGVEPRALRAYLAQRLPAQMVPSRFVAVASLPLTPSGKVDRRRVAELAATEAPAPATPPVGAASDLEATVSAVWARTLELARVPRDESFFELGGTSVLTLGVAVELSEALGREVPVTALFEHPTVARLAAYLDGDSAGESRPGARPRPARRDAGAPEPIAIVGMDCRLPGAGSVEEFWEALVEGRDGIRHFTREELLEEGVEPERLDDPDYVRARGMLDGADRFDAAFFGYTPREARLMDPQHRLFLESCWKTLESAGYPPDAVEMPVGVWGGMSTGMGYTTYLLSNLAAGGGIEAPDRLQVMLGNAYDYLTTRVSYKLDLRGPSVNVQTACSTSLVAVCQAVESLRRGDCDLALAGGVSVSFPQKAGYLHQEGGIESSDGRCRPFDADAEGTVFSDGVATVALRRLEDALRDGDPVHAVIHGVGVNNDGSDKVSFSAPSVQGQASAIRTAQEEAGFAPGSIGYVEAHGTATQLGDPIEMEALRRAFGEGDPGRDGPWCAVGSVKSNIGHTVAAAGAAALIKTALALREGAIPPSLHFERPNERIDFDHGPFRVAADLLPWPADHAPRRAGVSSFGLGGTNAHVVLQEAPAPSPSGPGRPLDLAVVSARDAETLEVSTRRLARHLEAHPEASWADAAHTTRVGRSPMPHRCAVVAADGAEAARALGEPRSPDAVRGVTPDTPPAVAFMFPGGGAQYPGMARDLLRREPVFRAAVERCAELLGPELDLVSFLESEPHDGSGDAAADHERPGLALPTLFSVEYALARLWMSWGVRPSALIGHSMGEYTAACLAGVMSLEDALRLVTARGRLFETLPPGSMTAVPLSEERLRAHLTPGLSVAVVNGPESCVASGPVEEIRALEERLEAQEIECRGVHIAVAAHSTMVDAILEDFRAVFADIELSPPRIPCVSNVTGTWLEPEDAVSPDYWVRHLRSTVRFSQGLETLAGGGGAALVEVGPGRTLASLARAHPATSPDTPVVASLRHPREDTDDQRFLLRSLARLWVGGVEVGWEAFVEGQERRRIALPTYPFHGPSHLVTPGEQAGRRAGSLPPSAGQPPAALLSSLQDRIRALQAAAGGAAPAGPPPAPPQDQTPPPRSTPVDRRDRILLKLKDVVRDLSGIPPEELSDHVSFLDMGFDSLFLTQASLGFKRAFGVRITFRQLFDEAPNLGALADYIDGELGPDVEVAAPAGTAAAPGEAPAPAGAPAGPAAAPAPGLPAAGMATGTGDIHQILALQLQATAALLSALSGQETPATAPPPPVAGGSTASAPAAERPTAAPPAQTPAPAGSGPGSASASPRPARASGPYRELNRERVSGLTDEQKEFLSDFMDRYIRKTRGSKELTQAHRDVFADPRAVAGFRKDWKEIVYPLAADRSKGSKMWDVDGNEYVDAVSGFGAIYFGHAPDFVVEAVDEQLHHSLDYGPQSTIAGEVARMVCRATGMDRASFCNTGSEAVLAAMRSARTATGRDTIVTFNGDYHGIFDEVLVRRQVMGDQTRNVPVAPGIPRSANQNMVVLDYGDPASLDRIRELGDELAGVLVEPVQSRTPELQPRAFLHGLRKLCTELDVPLIFDEIITGFRTHPQGAQGWFGVKADIAAYGKVIGGGMPIGVVAGKRLYLDSLDGGTWRFGDESFPEAGVTYFAGTFIRHPLSLSAVHAVLRHMEEHGGALQRTVNHRTARLAVELNDWFEERGLPIHVVHFSSFFLPRFGGPPEFDPIFHRLLHYHGLHLWEGRPGFLTTAHTEEDVDRMVASFKRAAEEMVQGGLLKPERAPGASSPAPREVRLTEPQTEIWLAAQMGDEGSRAFNEPVRLDLEGPLHLPALRRAVRKVVERHESLRATVRPDEPALRIHEAMTVDLPVVDLSDLGEDDRAAALEEHLLLASNEPFDLTGGPLIRFKLVRMEEERHLLLVTVHHIACDGWSIEITLRDLAAFYDTAVTGRELELEPPMQLGEYNEHYRSRRDDPEVEEMKRYWVERFQPAPPVLELPLDHPRPPEKTYHGARHAVRVDREVGQRLKQLGAERGCTLFTTLLAAFNVLLQKLSQERDVVVGVPAAGQALLGRNALVAHCVSFLPIRSTVDPERPFDEYLHELRGIVMDANDNQEYTYGALVEELALPRDPSRVPLVSASFNLDPEISGLSFHGLEWTYVPMPRSFSKLDMDLNVIETDGELLLEIDHNTDLIDRATALRWMDHYGDLLRSIAEAPERPIADLELVSAPEQARLVAGGGDPYAMERSPARIEELFEARAAETPSAPAMVFQGRTVSYGELHALARRIAARVRRAVGDEAEPRVGVMLDRSPEMVAALLGILKAGAAYVPLDPDFPDPRLKLIMDDADLAALVTSEAHASSAIDADTILLLEDLLEAGEDDEVDAPSEGGPDDLAYVIYTSGSTGRPKGVEVTHTSVVSFLGSMAETPGMGPEDRLLAVTTISFDISVLELFLPLTVGGTVILATQEVAQDGVALADLMERSAPTLMQATPTHWQLLLDSGWEGRPTLKALAGGEPLPGSLARRLAGACRELWNMYGPTETTIWSTCARVEPGDGPVRIGRPIANTWAYVLDGDLRPVAAGVPGQLFLGGLGVARGYRNRPELTAEKFLDDPHSPVPGRIYATGDLVRYGADGTLEFVGRSDRQVKVRGFRVELGDIENALGAYPGVDRAAVEVRVLGAGDARLVAWFTGESTVEEAALRRHLRGTLPEYMIPQALVPVSDFPLTANGKLDLRALPDPFDAAGGTEPGDAEGWADGVEARVAEVWRQVLGAHGFGRDDNFFDLGGHSVLATRVVSGLRSDMAPELGLRDLFRHPTVAGLSARVRELRTDGASGDATDAPETEEFIL